MARPRKVVPISDNAPGASGTSVEQTLKTRLHGQNQFIGAVTPYVTNFLAGMGPVGRPAGVFMLLGPTGSGKTYAVESLAAAIHGDPRHVLRIDCGEYQLEHEVAKLIGAPPGYLGHRETRPVFTTETLTGVTTTRNPLAIILFDEIEKAASSLHQILLGVMDKASLQTGSNFKVDFEKTLIFMTSNVGARQLTEAYNPIGFGGKPEKVNTAGISKLALKKRFSPEFLNRIDESIPFELLDRNSLKLILDDQVDGLNRMLLERIGAKAFYFSLDTAAREEIINLGYSDEYGAREIRRVLQKKVMNPLSALFVAGSIPPGSHMRIKGKTFRIALEKPSLLVPGVSLLEEDPILAILGGQ